MFKISAHSSAARHPAPRPAEAGPGLTARPIRSDHPIRPWRFESTRRHESTGSPQPSTSPRAGARRPAIIVNVRSTNDALTNAFSRGYIVISTSITVELIFSKGNKVLKSIAGFATTIFLSGMANAAYVVTVQPSGKNVVANGMGSLNITGLTRDSNFDGSSTVFIEPSAATLLTGTGQNFKSYDVTTNGPQNFGTNFGPFNGTGTGDSVYFNSGRIIGVPVAYSSGSLLNSTALFSNQTFASLGLTVGAYVYSFGSGLNADTFTIRVDPTPLAPTTPIAAVPEPATGAMMIGGFGLIVGAMRRRRKAVTRASDAV